nr:regulatory iron-sulfur-containing complex subunit RicT [Tessaracoccus sp. OS52]
MAVTFEEHGTLHYLDPGGGEFAVGDWVLYPTADGNEVARCVWAPQETADHTGPLPVCAGPATEADLHRDETLRTRRDGIRATSEDVIAEAALPMKVVATDYVDPIPDGGRLAVIYYTAPHRVDFRPILGPLARRLGARVDLRQVGPRDAARLQGGIGVCGRELCCSTFLQDFEPITMRLAAEQSLGNNPLQISGACGRLLCCLAYEHPLYQDFRRRAPAVGEAVTVDGEPGLVVGHNVPSERVVVKTSQGVVGCALSSVCSTAQDRRRRSPSV